MNLPPPPAPLPTLLPSPPPVLIALPAGDVHRVGPATPTAHVRRVTLNLIRHAACCPADLRTVIDHLADRLDWNIGALSEQGKELIYAYVSDDLAEKATAEFIADVSSLIDHRAGDATCKLCGHKHIRFEFLLRNQHEGGRDHWTGSTCIETYGLNVDGAATAEEALQLLRAAKSKAIRKASCDDWQAQFPTHETDMAAFHAQVRELHSRWRWPRWNLREHLPPRSTFPHRESPASFARRVSRALIPARAIGKYYDKHGFLTEKRTAQFYGEGNSVRTRIAALTTAAVAAQAAYDKERGAKHLVAPAATVPTAGSVLDRLPPQGQTRAKRRAWWGDLVAQYVTGKTVDPMHERRIARWQHIGLNARWLKPEELEVVEAVVSGTSAPPESEASPSADGRIDNSDLPF